MSVKRTTTALLPWWKRSAISKWNVTNFRVTDTPYWMAKFTMPGLSHESFDINSNPKITSIMHTSVMSRMYALNRPNKDTGNVFLDWNTLTDNIFTFVSSTEYKMSQKLYNQEIPKWPLDARFSLGFVGNSSVCNVIDFFLPGEEKDPLWTNVTQLVSVDMKTRKPTPLPNWFKEKYQGKGSRDKGLVIKGFDRAPVTYCHPVSVSWSDTDSYRHTNFASYVRFAIDSLHAALRHEASGLNIGVSSGGSADHLDSEPKTPLDGISKDIICNGLKDLQIVYMNESVEGENLDVHVWQQDGQEHIVWCAIERDGKDLCHMTLEYFESSV